MDPRPKTVKFLKENSDKHSLPLIWKWVLSYDAERSRNERKNR